jgi:hypothetical protein
MVDVSCFTLGSFACASVPQSKGLPRAKPRGPLYQLVTFTCDHRPFVGASPGSLSLCPRANPIGGIVHSTGRPICALLLCLAGCAATFAQNQPSSQPPTADKPHVFITDSQSWEMYGAAGGSNGNWGGQTRGGAHPQTAEIIKTFGERCPQVIVNNKQDIADYIVLLDHEGGKGPLAHKNKVAIFQKVSGDIVVSHSTLSLGGSVQYACEGIVKDWSSHGTQIRAAAVKTAAPTPSVIPAAAVSVKSAAVFSNTR